MDFLNGRNPFKNSLKINVPRGSEAVSRLSILKGLSSVSELDTSKITSISPFQYGNNWIIYFKQDYDCSIFVGNKVKVVENELCIESALNELDPYIYQTYRLHWLFELSNAEIEKIKDYFRKLNKYIEVIDVKPEFLNEESMKHIANGNYRVKIRFLASKKDEVKIKVGKHNLGNRVSTLVTRLGEKPKCLLCSAEDHLRKDCPKRKLKCDYCNKTGHKADECSLAKRLDKSNDIDEENDINSDDLNGNVQPEKEQAINENDLANNPNPKTSQPNTNPRISAFQKPNDPSKPPEKPIHNGLQSLTPKVAEQWSKTRLQQVLRQAGHVCPPVLSTTQTNQRPDHSLAPRLCHSFQHEAMCRSGIHRHRYGF